MWKKLFFILILGMIISMPTPSYAKNNVTESEKTYNLENSIVRAYLNHTNYTGMKYKISYIKKYAKKAKGRCDRPNAVRITFPKINMNVSLTISSSKKIVNVISGNGSMGYFNVYNLEPHQKYSYLIRNIGGTIIASGHFQTTGKVRMCYVDGVYNVRDIGGWRTVSGKTIRYGKIYRGGELNRNHHITAIGKKQMIEELGIETEIDLRNNQEISGLSFESALGSDVTYRHVAIAAYDIKRANSKKLKTVFRLIFDNVKHGKPVYFHCVAGADRAGTVSFLIEGLLGLSESDLSKDYELTSFYCYRSRNSKTKHNYKGLIRQVKKYHGKTIQKKIQSYFISLGFTKKEIKEFRSEMLQ